MVMKHWTKYVSSSSTSTKSVPARTMSESSCLTPLMPGTSELRTALSELENRKPGAVEAWDDECGWEAYDPSRHTPEDTWVRCGCCNDWADPLALYRWADELICQECEQQLAEDGVFATAV